MSYNKYYDKLVCRVIENYTKSALLIQKWWRYFIKRNNLISLFVKSIVIKDFRWLLIIPRIYNSISSSVVKRDISEFIIYRFCIYFNYEVECGRCDSLSSFFDNLCNKLLIQTLILEYHIDLRFRVIIE